jgi:hypothetical protein
MQKTPKPVHKAGFFVAVWLVGVCLYLTNRMSNDA